MTNDFLNRHRYTLMALLSGAILIGSGICLGIGLFGKQATEVTEATNVTKVLNEQMVNEKMVNPLEERLNINTAPADELALYLKGIGPSKAQAIIDYRNKNGPFKSITEIQNVSGIGPKTFEKLKELITVK